MLHKNAKKVISGVLGSCLVLQLAALPSLAQGPQTQSAQDGVLLDATAQWHYLDDNTDPAGTAGSEGYDIHSWTAADFDDSGWKTAAGPFGSKRGGADLGGGYVASTVLEGCTGQNDTTTYFFRTTFTLDSLDGVTQLVGTLQHDDAAVVYLNGHQVAAYDAGELSGTDNMEYAGVSAGNPQTQTFTVTDRSILQEGENTLAVEVHNDRPTSSDIWFHFTGLTASNQPLDTELTDINLSVGGDNTQMNVTWYAAQAEPGYVLVAKQSELVDGAMPGTAARFEATSTPANESGKYSNQATLTGLEPGVTYAYQLVNGDEVSAVATFTTGGGDSFSFAFAGDPQIGASGNAGSDTEGWANTLGIIAQNSLFDGVDFLLSAGDQVNTASNEEQYDGYLDHQELLSLPVATVVGNHDSSSNAYDQHFNEPNQSGLGATAASSDYWFVYNNTLFLVLNSNSMSTAEHKAFMEQAIAEAGDVAWKVVTFHHSIYSVASHAVDGDILQRREALVPVFDQLDIDVVLMGHDHVYVRSYMMDGLTPITQSDKYTDTNGDGIPEAVTDPEGILYVTANSASGSKFYTIQNTKYEYSAVQNQERVPNVSRVDVSENAFTITTYRTSDMSVVDTFTINRTSTAAADKSALEGLVAEVQSMDLSGYTAESVAALQKALREAQAVLADETLTEDDQATVDAAVEQLSAALDGLTAQGEQPQVTPAPEVTDKPQATEKPENVPQTGDEAAVGLYVVTLAASLALLGGAVAVQKRRDG